MPTSAKDQQTTGNEAPFGLREIDTIIGQTSKLVREMLEDALTKIRKRAETEASS